MTDLDTKQLRELAEKATPSLWTADVWLETDGSGWRATGPHHEEEHATVYDAEPGCPDEQAAQRDAAFIAAASPSTVLALLDRLAAAEKERVRLATENIALSSARSLERQQYRDALSELANVRAERDAAVAERDKAIRERDMARASYDSETYRWSTEKRRAESAERELAKAHSVLGQVEAERLGLTRQLAECRAERDAWKSRDEEGSRTLKAVLDQRDAAEKERDDYKQRKDAAYDERNNLVAALARLALASGWRAGIGKHQPDPDPTWNPEWLNVIYIETPWGQLSWHIHERQLPTFTGLPACELTWDGHSTPEKYARLDRAWRDAGDTHRKGPGR